MSNTPYVGARGRLKLCQETTGSDGAPCLRPAVGIVDNGDEHPYWMCKACMAHNIRNRGGERWWSTKQIKSMMELL
jgi:hypothetical protein